MDQRLALVVQVFGPFKHLQGNLHRTRNGDTVFAQRVGGERGDEARVYAVVSRGLREVTGTYYREKKGGFLEPDERRLCDKIRVTGGERAASGEKVVCNGKKIVVSGKLGTQLAVNMVYEKPSAEGSDTGSDDNTENTEKEAQPDSDDVAE